MTTTAHERAFLKATEAHNNAENNGENGLEAGCKAYLQARLDDAETVGEVAKSIMLLKSIQPHSEFYEGELNWCRLAAQNCIATLKRMGSVS